MANTIQPNNNTSLYNSTGNAVPTTGNLDANNINASGNVTVGGYIIANGSITTTSNFVGNLVGNVTGNVTGNIVLSGGNTQIIYNNNGVTGSSPAFTFNQASNVVSATGNVTANYFLGNGSQLTGLPATYGNANVEALLPVYTGDFAGANINLTGYASATGNITGNYILGNGSQLTGITANYSNANVQAFLPTYSGNLNPNFVSATGNVTAAFLKTSGAQGNITGANYVSANFYLGDGGLLSNISSTYGNAQVATFLNAFGSNTISSTGNITTTANISGNYILGNGSQLTGLSATYGNANVTTLLAAFGSNTISTTGNITAGYIVGNGSLLSNITGANVTGTVALATQANVANTANAVAGANVSGSVAQANYANIANSVSGSNVSGSVAQATFADTANAVAGGNVSGQVANALVAGTVYTNAQPNITSVGTLSSLSVTGNIATGGILTDNYYYANGAPFSGGGGTYGNANVNTLLAAWGSNALSTTGNVTSGYVIGNGSLLTNLTGANVTGTVANATFATSAGTATSATTAGTVTANAQANITSVGTLSSLSVTGDTTSGNLLTGGLITATGNVIAGNVFTGGVVSATGNVTGNYFLGNGSQLTGISAAPGGSNTQLQFNNANALAGNAAMTFNTSTGNITLGNIIVELDQQIQTVSAYSGNTSGRNAGQITVGDGLAGNITDTTYLTTSARGARLLSYDGYVKVDNGSRNTQLAALSYANLNGSTTFGTANNNSRIQGVSSELSVINGNSVQTSPNLIRGTVTNVFAGSGANTGNANIASLSVVYGFAQTYAGSRIGNAWIYTADSLNAGTTGPLETFIGFSSAPQHTANVTTGNVFGVYQANNTATYGRATANVARQANQYYFLRNDDDLARSRLGMLDRFHELNANTATTTGTVNIDKTSGQVQTIYPTGNVTIGTFSNFVTRVQTPSGTQVNTADTVTLIIQQGATPYTVTMPTGNTQIRYAGGNSTVANTANATTTIRVTGVYDYNAAANEYLVTISPEFS